MTFLHAILKRIALGFAAAWAVLTAVFAAFTLSQDWMEQTIEGTMRFGGAGEAEIEVAIDSYLQAHDLDRSLWAQYVDWMGNMLTLDWGESLFVESEMLTGETAPNLYESGEPVFPMVMEATARTAAYVLPAIALAVTAGLLVGLYVAINPGSRLGNASLGSAYLLFALPNFWVGGILVSLAAGGVIADSPLLFDHALPILLTATTLLGGYVSYARAHSLEYAAAEFVKLVEAKGASNVRVARHILRNSAIPFVSMLFTEALALLVLAVFVIETLFGIPGFGMLLFEAVHLRDLPVVLGCILVIIAVGIAGNVVQDLAYGSLDPRVDTGRR
nr:ABC transporter permease [Halobiforma nitratireducens]